MLESAYPGLKASTGVKDRRHSSETELDLKISFDFALLDFTGPFSFELYHRLKVVMWTHADIDWERERTSLLPGRHRSFWIEPHRWILSLPYVHPSNQLTLYDSD